MDCVKCKKKCCYDINLCYKKLAVNRNIEKPISLSKYPIGTILNIEGIVLKRKEKMKWDCVFYDFKSRKCKIYDSRPILCRVWFCKKHQEKNIEFPKDYTNDERFIIYLTDLCEINKK